ncbi:MAG: ATP-binding protein [Candidatus Cloacimonetes bacterium]|nr:ATP-binding protein [Candidatus Cloacimonadota bacterium]MCK9184501.1 ATP-binding protein [Candidatus Cloacimonadota bacterium]
MQNPFQYGKVVSDAYFTDREEEFASIVAEVKNRHNLVMYSPRRYGKTSLLLKIAQEMKARGWNVIYLDFYRVTSLHAFIEIYAREVFYQSDNKWKSGLKKIASLVKGIHPVVSIDSLGNPAFSISFDPVADLPQTLESVLNLTEVLNSKQKWLVIFDEFQEITKLNGMGFDNHLRSVIQHHQKSSYIFSGSRYHMLMELFNQPKKAFYRFGKMMHLDKIPVELMKAFLIERFASTGIKLGEDIAQAIIDRADNIPNYVQFIAAETWQLVWLNKSSLSLELVDQAVQTVLDNQKDYFMQIWDTLSIQQKKTLVALSKDNSNPYSLDYQKLHNLGATSTIQGAIKRLIADEIIVFDTDVYLFSDPLFKLFIQLRIVALRRFT